jgi:hypothetical protein
MSLLLGIHFKAASSISKAFDALFFQVFEVELKGKLLT